MDEPNPHNAVSRGWRVLLAVTGFVLIPLPLVAYALFGARGLLGAPAGLYGGFLILVAVFANQVNGPVKLWGLELTVGRGPPPPTSTLLAGQDESERPDGPEAREQSGAEGRPAPRLDLSIPERTSPQDQGKAASVP